MSHTEQDVRHCPVPGCTNPWDEEVGICWRHRQFVHKRMVNRIRECARRVLVPTSTAVDRCENDSERDLRIVIEEAAAAARRWEQAHVTR